MAMVDCVHALVVALQRFAVNGGMDAGVQKKRKTKAELATKLRASVQTNANPEHAACTKRDADRHCWCKRQAHSLNACCYHCSRSLLAQMGAAQPPRAFTNSAALSGLQPCSLLPPAGVRRRHQRARQQLHTPLLALPPDSTELLLSTLLMLGDLGADTFEPQMRPEIGIAAAVAGWFVQKCEDCCRLRRVQLLVCSTAQLPHLFSLPFEATPPIWFWIRIFISAQKRQAAIDQERAAEEQRQREREVSSRGGAGGL